MGTGGILGGWGVNGRGASLRPPVPPFGPAKCPAAGRGCLSPSSGAAGSASPLLGNGSLIYQVRVRVGQGSSAGGEKAAGQGGGFRLQRLGPSPSLLLSPSPLLPSRYRW